MKYDCEVIRDLLPLYKDGVTSEKSNMVVSEHLEVCKDCRKYYEEIKKDDLPVDGADIKETSKVLDYAKKIKNRRLTIAAAVVASFLVLTSCFVSYIKFEVANPISAGMGLVKILITNAQYTEIQKSPRVVLAKPDNAWNLFLETMKDEGYDYLENERLGSMCVFQKNGIKENVFFFVNGYYSRWVWGR